jgi:hypothetical protein
LDFPRLTVTEQSPAFSMTTELPATLQVPPAPAFAFTAPEPLSPDHWAIVFAASRAPVAATPLTTVAGAVAADAAPVPSALLPWTVKEASEPSFRPGTAHCVPEVRQVCPPGVAVTVHTVDAPPTSAGAAHESVVFPADAVAASPVGVPGTDTGSSVNERTHGR